MRVIQTTYFVIGVADGRSMRSGLDVLVKNHIFVGVADVDTSLSMIQHATKLYLVNHASLSYVFLTLSVFI